MLLDCSDCGSSGTPAMDGRATPPLAATGLRHLSMSRHPSLERHANMENGGVPPAAGAGTGAGTVTYLGRQHAQHSRQSSQEEVELVVVYHKDTERDLEDRPLLEDRGAASGGGGGGGGLGAAGHAQGDGEEDAAGGRLRPDRGRAEGRGPKEFGGGSKKRLSWDWKRYLKRSLGEMLLGTKINVLAPSIPICLIVSQLGFGHGYVFFFSLVGIAPLAERLGYVTEQLALHTGSTVGGLLNATFGNATELIVSLFAMRKGLIRVVQLSLLGSILSNMLLVLGCAFLFGGLKRKEQRFNKTAALVSSGLLLMAVMGLMFPAVLQSTHTELHGRESELVLSRFSACVMLTAYACYLFFQLKSHAHLYDERHCEEGGEEEEAAGGEREEEEEDVLGLYGCIFWLAVLTALISVLSEYLVSAIEGAASAWQIPVVFISVVILPIVGNAAEHASAIIFACKDKLDISLGVAIGSSTQIAMFAIPFCVVVGWATGVDVDLNFHIFETATLLITVLVVAVLLQEGKANYFKGLMLVLSYLIVAASFFVHSDVVEPNPGDTPTLP